MPQQAEDFDIVSDLQDGSYDSTVSAHEGQVDTTTGEAVKAQSPTKTDKQERPVKETDTLRDQISSALKGTDEGTPSQDGQPRSPDGRFAAKEATEAAAGEGVSAVSAAPVATPVAPPPYMTPAEQQVFSQLPAELQTSVARTYEVLAEREASVTGLSQLDQLIAPRRHAWALEGMTDAQALNQLLAVSDFATNDPAGFIKFYANQQGIDLEGLLYDDDPVDPVIAGLQSEITTLRGQVDGFANQQAQAAHNAIVQEVIDFADAKDASGQLVRPYCAELGEALMPHVSYFMQRNPGMSRLDVLQQAYDAACWSVPSVRAKIQQAQAAATEAERVRTQQERTFKARDASAGLAPGVPSNDVTPSNPQNRSLRDELRHQLRNAQG
jgi:hypothetical protein